MQPKCDCGGKTPLMTLEITHFAILTVEYLAGAMETSQETQQIDRRDIYLQIKKTG